MTRATHRLACVAVLLAACGRTDLDPAPVTPPARAESPPQSGPVPVNPPPPPELGLDAFVAQPRFATIGDVVVLRFRSSEPLPGSARSPGPNPEALLAGRAMACVSAETRHECRLRIDEGFQEGPASFEVRAAGRTGAERVEIPPLDVTLDFTAPGLELAASPAPVVAGEPVTFTIVADEDLDPAHAPEVIAAFLVAPTSCAGGPRSFLCTGSSVAADARAGAAAAQALGLDVAGNAGRATTNVEVLRPTRVTLPNVTAVDSAPDPAREGDVLVVSIQTDQALDACAAYLDGDEAECAPPLGTACTCRVAVTQRTGEGERTLVALATNAAGTGRGTGRVEIDRTPPRVDAARAWIVRRPVGEDDAVEGLPGAALDDGGHLYERRAVTALRLWSSAVTADPVAALVPAGDGSLATAPLAGTDGTDATRLAHRRLWASAVDLPGNESDRVELGGADAEGPVVDGTLLAIVRHDLSRPDGLAGRPGAFTDGSALRAVRAYDAGTGGSLVASTYPDEAGGFAEVPVGTPTASFPRLWLEGEDKCGNVGARVATEVGTDDEPPVVDGSLVTYEVHPWGQDEAATGVASAVTDAASAVVEVRVHDDPAGGTLLAVATPSPDGSFTAAPLPDLAPSVRERVYLEAVDKVGWSSSLSASTGLRIVATTADCTAGPAPAPLRFFRSIEDDDPRGLAPRELRPGWTEADGPACATLEGAGGDVERGTAEPDPGEDVPSWHRWTPPYYTGHAPAYDASRDRVVLFGGWLGETGEFGDETWEFDGDRWWFASPPSRPAARGYHQMVYDAGRRRIVMFGGNSDAGPLRETWEYDGLTWTQIPTRSSPPRGVTDAMTYDRDRGRVIFVGGWSGALQTWEYDGVDWTRIRTSAAPSERVRHSIAYDESRRVVVLFGGGRYETLFGDTWEYDGSNWTEVTPATSPDARVSHSLAYDAARRVIVLFGRYSPGDGTWEYDGSTWREVLAAQASPPPVHLALAYDGARGRVLAVGGVGADTWAYDGASWSQIHSFGPALSSYDTSPWAVATFDAARGRAVLVNGGGSTWEHDGRTWIRPQPAASPPSGDYHVIAFDPVRGRTVLVVGRPGRRLPAETWEHDGLTWTAVPGASLPETIGQARATYDSNRRRVVLLDLTGDTWEYDGAGWLPIGPGPRPGGWADAALVLDEARGRVVALGSRPCAPACVGDTETWEFDGTAWQPVATATRPPGRTRHVLAFDARRGRVVLFGGTDGSAALVDTWEYDGVDWTEIATPGGQPLGLGNVAVYDPVRDHVLLAGPTEFNNASQTWTYRATAPHARAPVHSFLFEPGVGAELRSLDVSYVGAATGDDGGVVTPGVELLAWDVGARTWLSVGSHTALGSDPVAARTITAAVVPPLLAASAAPRLWLQAVPLHASSDPPGTLPSELSSDHVEVRASYVLP